MFNFGPIFLVLVGPPFYLHGTFQPSMFPWNGSLHDHWDPTKVPYLFQDKRPKLHGLLGWISTCARTQATYCCNQEALPHQPADVAEALLRMQFQQSGWFFGIFGWLARRDTYQKITLYYVETSVKGQFKCLAMAFYEKTLLQYILFEPSWWPNLCSLLASLKSKAILPLEHAQEGQDPWKGWPRRNDPGLYQSCGESYPRRSARLGHIVRGIKVLCEKLFSHG